MTEYRIAESFPFDSSKPTSWDDYGRPVLDRAVGARVMREVFAKFFSNGVFPNPGNAFQIGKGSGLSITVQPGICIINGAMGGWPDAAQTFALDAAMGKVAHGVFLRYDGNSDKRSLYVRVAAGTAGTNPVPPEPESGPEVTELRIGYVIVPSGATDLSGATVVNEKGLDVCPYAAPFEKIDLSEIISDVQAQGNQSLANFQKYLAHHMELIASALDDSTAGLLQTQIDELRALTINEESIDYDHFSFDSDDPTARPKLRIKKTLLDAMTQVAGAFTNAGSGWNTLAFATPFNDVPAIVATPNATGYTVEIKDVTASHFLYRVLKSGTATADAVEVMWVASERNDIMAKLNAIVDTGYTTVTALMEDREAVAACAASGEAMTVLYGDATARSALFASEDYMDLVVSSAEALSALEAHAAMERETLAADMPAAKYIAASAGLDPSDYSTCSDLLLTTIAVSSVTESEKAFGRAIRSDPYIRVAALDKSWQSAVVTSDEASATIVGSAQTSAKFAAVAAGLSADAYPSFATMAASNAAVSSLAESDFSLWLLCQNDAARTAWMQSSYAHTYYDSMYATLHGSNLFNKYEDYYESGKQGGFAYNVAYTNETGGFSKGDVATTSYTEAMADAEPINGIVLLDKAYMQSGHSYYIGSSQTKASLTFMFVSDDGYEDLNYVLVGGMCVYPSNYGKQWFATYVAK